MVNGSTSIETSVSSSEVLIKHAVSSSIDIEGYPLDEPVPTFSYYLQKSLDINSVLPELVKEKVVNQEQGRVVGTLLNNGSLAYSDDEAARRGEEIMKAEELPAESVTGWFVVHKDKTRGIEVEVLGKDFEQAEKLTNFLKQTGLPGTAALTVLLKSNPADFTFVGAKQWYEGWLAGFQHPRK